MKPFIFFDLDGTLLDSRERLYLLFQHLVPDCTHSFESYWFQKREGVSHRRLLKDVYGYSDDRITQFESDWMRLIEDPSWLAHDRVINGVHEMLDMLRVEHHIALITARQSPERVAEQLKEQGIGGYFDEVLVTGQRSSKEHLLHGRTFPPNSWTVGDSGEDVMLGKAFSMKTAAVLSGFKSREYLERYQPDQIMEDVTHLKEVITKD